MTQLTRRSFMQASLTLSVAAAADRITESRWLLATQDRIRVGVIGLGDTGLRYLGVLCAVPCAHIATLCDVQVTSLRAAANALSDSGADAPKLALNHNSLFNDPSLDALIVAAPIAKLTSLIRNASVCNKNLFLTHLPRPVECPDIHDAAAQFSDESGHQLRTSVCGYMDTVLRSRLSPSLIASRIGKLKSVAVRVNTFLRPGFPSPLPLAAAIDLALQGIIPVDLLQTAVRFPVLTEERGPVRYLSILDHSIQMHSLAGPSAVRPTVEFDGTTGRSTFTVPEAPDAVTIASQLVNFLHSSRFGSTNGNLAAQRSLLSVTAAASIQEAAVRQHSKQVHS